MHLRVIRRVESLNSRPRQRMPGIILPHSAIVERYALLVMLGTLQAPITELVLVWLWKTRCAFPT